FQAPGNNWSGHIWGRTSCDLNKSGSWSCATDDCGTGEVECKRRNFTESVTLAELNMMDGDNYYDVSLLSGFNLPMTIEAKGTEDSCRLTGCAQIRGIPDDLSLGIRFPGDMSPEISGTEKLEWDSFPGDISGPT
ncbi:thaumatin-like protein 1, partial [Tanacetum coccineum]